MANHLRYTLVSDGPTDRVLLPIIAWVLEQIPWPTERRFEPQFAEPRDQQRDVGLAGKIESALKQFPCDLLFVHRDAESRDEAKWHERHEEIKLAMEGHSSCYVPIVPVRMTEAWLLIDRAAICHAADNPHSKADVSLPPLRRLEDQADPKTLLHELLAEASELTGRRAKAFRGDLTRRRCIVPEYISDFTPLRQLPAFRAFEEETRRTIESLSDTE